MIPRRHIPNALTVLRLILAAAFFACVAGFRVPDVGILWGNAAIVVFVAAVVTDALDGHLARKWDVTSVFGRIMDPLCDKVLVLGAFFALSGPGFVVSEWLESGRTVPLATGVMPWMAVIVLTRELLVTAIRGTAESMGVAFGAQGAGKLKMIIQSVAIPVILLLTVNFDPESNNWAMMINHGMVWAVIVISVWSGIPYVTGFRRLLGDDRRGVAEAPAKDPSP